MFLVFSSMFIRLAVGILALIVYINLLGRMQLSPQSGIDQIGNYILGGILGGVIYNLDLEFYKFFIAIIIWTFLMLVLTYLTNESLKLKRAVQGRPILLMEEGEFRIGEFEKNKIHIDDIISKLHQKGIYSVVEVRTLWLEPNGVLTAILKSDENIGWVLIEAGQINHIDLERLNRDEAWLLEELNRQGISKVEDVFYSEYLNGELLAYGY